MRFDVVTLFPDIVSAWADYSIVKRAQEKGLVQFNVVDVRSFSRDRRRTADGALAGGGVGMLMMLDPLVAAIEHCLTEEKNPNRATRVLLMTPQGRRLEQSMLEAWSVEDQIIVLCGHYEGIDDRIRFLATTDEVSLGDFVITGGELAAAAVVEGIVRLIPGVLGKDESAHDESFTSGLLEYPQYTLPREFQGESIPSVLLGGNHSAVLKWRQRQAILRTAAIRPDLLPPDWRDRLNPRQKIRRRGHQTISE